MEASQVALAQLGMMDEGPVAMVQAAAAAGFHAIGLPLRSGALRLLKTEIVGNRALVGKIRDACRANRVTVFDVEALVLGHEPADDDLNAMLETAAELGASRISCLGCEAVHGPGSLADEGELEAFARLAERVGRHGLVLGLEFMAFRSINSLGSALALIKAASAPNTGIVIDALHAFRTGASPAQIASLPKGAVSHFQLCDAAATLALDSLAEEARVGRLLPGAGAIPLAEMVAALPTDTPLSLEIPSQELMRLPVAERARLGAASLASLSPKRNYDGVVPGEG